MPSPISTSTMPAKFTPSAEEAALVAQMFAHGDSHKVGVLTGDVALDIFGKTNLSPQVLSDIWCIADEEGNGWLSPKRTEVAVRLIGWAQVGVKPTADLVDKPGPLARIPNLAGGLAGPSKIVSSSVIPPFVPEDKDKFLKVFLNSGPVNGLIDGERAREKFLKSNLPPEKLSQIWDLSDTVQRGALNSTEFCIALHLIQGLMTKKFSSVPASLPSGLYQQIEGDPLETKTQSSVMTTPSSPNTSPLDDSKSLHNGSFQSSPSTSSRPPNQQFNVLDWDVPSTVKPISDRQFDALDPLKNGFIHDNISLPFLLESKLPPEDLARIWTLADLNGDGKLTRDGFAIAFFLLDERRRGNPLPNSRPSSLKSKITNAQGLRKMTRPQTTYLPEKSARLDTSTTDSLERRVSRVIYPALPSQSSNFRHSSVWTPGKEVDFSNYASSTNLHDAAISHLTRQTQEMQKLIAQLRISHVDKAAVITNLTRENESLRVLVQELQATAEDPESQRAVREVLARENEGLRTTMQQMEETLRQLQASSSDMEMERIQYDDLARENERLMKQVTEMRESTTQLPWSGGDSELQTLINEDLARENARLRLEAREMQENVAQLQEATADYQEQRRINSELLRDNERRQATTATMQAKLDARRTEVHQLTREIDRLKTQLRTAASARSSGRPDADVPPPAYDEVDLTATITI